MAGYLILALALSAGAIYTIINPILLPDAMVLVISDSLQSLWWLSGILPIDAIFKCLYLDFLIFLGFLIFKIFFGAVAGKPEID